MQLCNPLVPGGVASPAQYDTLWWAGPIGDEGEGEGKEYVIPLEVC